MELFYFILVERRIWIKVNHYNFPHGLAVPPFSFSVHTISSLNASYFLGCQNCQHGWLDIYHNFGLKYIINNKCI